MMNPKLAALIFEAQDRLNPTVSQERIEELKRSLMNSAKEAFQESMVEWLGTELLEALGAVFEDGRMSPAMSFHQDGCSFEITRSPNIADMVDFVELQDDGFSRRMLLTQLHIKQRDAKDIFLDALGQALKQ